MQAPLASRVESSGDAVRRWTPAFRFHRPLIEPDGRISRIRLSDQSHGFAHRGRRRTLRTKFANPMHS